MFQFGYLTLQACSYFRMCQPFEKLQIRSAGLRRGKNDSRQLTANDVPIRAKNFVSPAVAGGLLHLGQFEHLVTGSIRIQDDRPPTGELASHETLAASNPSQDSKDLDFTLLDHAWLWRHKTASCSRYRPPNPYALIPIP